MPRRRRPTSTNSRSPIREHGRLRRPRRQAWCTSRLTSPVDDALLSASVDGSIAGSVELHETMTMDDDGHHHGGGSDEESGDTTGTSGAAAMTMEPVDRIELPADETVSARTGRPPRDAGRPGRSARGRRHLHPDAHLRRGRRTRRARRRSRRRLKVATTDRVATRSHSAAVSQRRCRLPRRRVPQIVDGYISRTTDTPAA